MPSISILVHDVSSPILGWATETAQILARHFPVQIVGPDLGHGVCPMYRDAFPYTVVSTPRLYRLPNFLWERRRIRRAVTGEVVLAFKAFADTVPVALQLKKRRGARVVVCLDEWDGAIVHRRSTGEKLSTFLRHIHHPLEDVYAPWVERLIPRADAVVSTTTRLQGRFGGVIIPMGADVDVFAPLPEDLVERKKAACGAAGLRLIVFGGVVRPHKGIDQLAEAIVRLGRSDCRLMVVGPKTSHLLELCQDARTGPYILAMGPHPKAKMPEFLAMADAVALPLVDDALARTQMPCKVFEAMAMAKTVIATDVSDLSRVLEGCGMLVPPGDVSLLADRIGWVLDHPAEARAMGQAARERCRERYSRQSSERAWVELIDSLKTR